MVTAPSVETEEITVALPVDVLREIDRVAADMGLTRNALMIGAARRFLFSEERWRRLQAVGAERAREAGLFTEDDVEEYLDSLSD